MAFKIMDVRLNRRTDGTVTCTIDGLGVGTPLSSPVDPIRAALMLAVFATGRDCYWDDAKVFTTMPAEWNADGSPINEGRVSAWEVRIPEAAGHRPEVLLYLVARTDTRQTSGNPATGWVLIEAPQRDIPVFFALLASRYCYYSPSGLRNTDITEDV